VHPPPSAPSSLKTVSVPKPDLSAYVANQTALIQLGKTLFWDMQMGSDGIQACASCHFHAGADHRIKNSLNPGTNANPSLTWFTSGDFNNTVAASDYPFHRFSNPADKNSAVVYDQPARTGSQGVFLFHFLSVIPGSALDNGTVLFDDTFQIGGANIRRVEPRNTPTAINAVFNHRNFWDGRASFNFNGRSPFGLADPNAAILVNGASLTSNRISIPYSSLASQAVGPMLSNFEMS
jgi:cytochrome c peroxidase